MVLNSLHEKPSGCSSNSMSEMMEEHGLAKELTVNPLMPNDL
jgi:hypothetical protein